MIRSGNPNQWKDSRPSQADVCEDIERGRSYVAVDGQEIAGVFAFIIGDDPTYKKIDGRWRGTKSYGTIHRLAAKDGKSGIFDLCLEFCLKKINDIRIDTHEKNYVMRHLITTRGFEFCGTIITDDGTERLAYELIKEKSGK